ncbi:hypothetical protein LNP04_08285 [Chryseobacterium sp. C-71]|uniref:hypothetical protein n=1 Tax=Chryseobacterium sp. C-71 TaxID=2893882 RepID=UPI001E6349B5|nr:hypothetical protein [Chryseobacterium sp. C-71]UFH33688.1 hypothetical protein LNP04_08285 [Chryseobacterium sp. C-71]
MDYSDAIKIAVLMPKIFNFYNNYKGMKSTEIGIDNDMKEEVFSLIESLRQKNSNNANLNIIFDNVKKDVGFLHNKTISEINEVLY